MKCLQGKLRRVTAWALALMLTLTGIAAFGEELQKPFLTVYCEGAEGINALPMTAEGSDYWAQLPPEAFGSRVIVQITDPYGWTWSSLQGAEPIAQGQWAFESVQNTGAFANPDCALAFEATDPVGDWVVQALLYLSSEPMPAAETEEPFAEPEPTEEPIPEYTAEQIPEYTEEPTPEPTEEPIPEDVVEPTPEPTEEPTPEPTEEPIPEYIAEPAPEYAVETTPEPTVEPAPVYDEEPVYDLAGLTDEEPAMAQAGSAFVYVNYWNVEDYTPIDSDMIEIPAGATQQVTAKEIGGYELAGGQEPYATVTVSASGEALPGNINFWMKRLPETVKVPVYYLNAKDGTQLGEIQEEVMQPGTSRTVQARAMEGYEVMAGQESSVQITVDEEGRWNPEQIVFWMTEKPWPIQVIVNYLDEAGDLIQTREQSILSSERSTPVVVEKLEGYTLLSAEPQRREVQDEQGRTVQILISYVFRMNPQDAVITVNYLLRDGTPLREPAETVVKVGLTQKIYAESIQGYLLEDGQPTEVEVSVDSEGHASRSTVEFYYKPLPKSAMVTVQYVLIEDDGSQTVRESETIEIFENESRTLQAKAIEGLLLVEGQPTEVTVAVDGNGVSSLPDDIQKFYYQLPPPVDAAVWVHYCSVGGKEITAPVQITLPGNASTTVEPDPSLVPEGFDAASAEGQVVQVTRAGAATPAEVTFKLSRIVSPLETPIPQGMVIDRWAVTTDKGVNQRKTPKRNGHQVTNIGKTGTYVWAVREELNEAGEPWTLVIYKGKSGYVHSSLLRVLSQAESDDYQELQPTPVPTTYVEFTPEVTPAPVPESTPVPEIPEAVESPAENPVEQAEAAPDAVEAGEVPAQEAVEVPGEEPGAVPAAEETPTEQPAITLAPTEIPAIPTPAVESTPVPPSYTGYAIAERDTTLWYEIGANGSQTVHTGDVLKVDGQYYASQNVAWSIVTTQDAISGYVQDADLRRISDEEADAILHPAPVETPVPTAVPMQFGGPATVLGDHVMLRAIPDARGAITAELKKDAAVTVTGQVYNPVDGWIWHSVQADGKDGYIRSDMLRMPADTASADGHVSLQEPDQSGASSYGTIYSKNNGYVNLRSGASGKGTRVVKKLHPKDLCLILQKVQGDDGTVWYEIEFEGTRGFVKGEFFKPLTLAEYGELFADGKKEEPILVEDANANLWTAAGSTVEYAVWSPENLMPASEVTPEAAEELPATPEPVQTEAVPLGEIETADPADAQEPEAVQTQEPPQYFGYAVTTQAVFARNSVYGGEEHEVPADTLVVVSGGQVYDGRGIAWSVVTETDGTHSYIEDSFLRRITENAALRYMTAGQESTPSDLPVVTPTPEPYSGYALTQDITPVYFEVGGTNPLRREPGNILMQIDSQMYDSQGRLWSSIRDLDGNPGFVLDSQLIHIHDSEAEPYIQAYREMNQPETAAAEATPEPVQYTGYACAVGNDVMLRSAANDRSVILRVLTQDTPVFVSGQLYDTEDGWPWHSVQYDGQWGYIRSDQLRMMSNRELNNYLNSGSAIPESEAPASQTASYTMDSLSSYGYIYSQKGGKVNIRSAPSTSGTKIVRSAFPYALCLVLGKQTVDKTDWFYVDYDGARGYVREDFFRQMTLLEMEEFLQSPEYQEGLNKNANVQAGATAAPYQAPISVEEHNAQTWSNPESAGTVAYATWVPIATTPPLTMATSTPTANPYAAAQELPDVSYEPLPTPAPTEEGPVPIGTRAPETHKGGGSLGWILLLLALLLLSGGGYAYYLHTKNKRSAAQRAAQRRAQAQQGTRGGTGRPVNPSASNPYKQQFSHPETPATPKPTPVPAPVPAPKPAEEPVKPEPEQKPETFQWKTPAELAGTPAKPRVSVDPVDAEIPGAGQQLFEDTLKPHPDLQQQLRDEAASIVAQAMSALQQKKAQEETAETSGDKPTDETKA